MTSGVFIFVQYTSSIFFLITFLIHFLPRRYSVKMTLVGYLICFLLVNGVNFWSDFLNESDTFGVFLMILQVIVVQGGAVILCRYRDFRALFVGMTSSIYVMIGDMLCTLIDVYTGNKMIALMVQIVVHMALLVVLVRMIKDKLENEMELRTKNWEKLCVLPALLYIISYMMSRWPMNIYKTPLNGIPLVMLLLLMMFCYVLVMDMLDADRNEANIRESKEFLETFARGVRREVEITNQKEAEMRIYRHDTRHTYQIMKTYLETGEVEKLRNLLEQLGGQIDEIRPERYCENIAVNGIITSLKKKASENRVQVFCETDIPARLKVLNEYELATVISNLLENAVIAAGKVPKVEDRKVYIRAFPFKAQYMIEVKNVYSGTLEFSKSTGLPKSRGDGLHGHGLRSVQAYADKTGAILEISHANQEFIVRLLFNR